MTDEPPATWGQPPPGGGPPPYGGSSPGPTPPPTASRASTVLVLGIVSVVTFFAMCGLGIVPAVIALAMAPGARREIAAAGGALQGESQVRTGVILAWVTVGLAALLLVVLIVLIALLVAASDSSGAVAAALPGAPVSAF